MPTSFSHIVPHLFTLPLLLLQSLQYCYHYYIYLYHCYHYYHTTLLLNTLLQILSYPGVVELTTQLLILKNILWLPLCRINKFGLNTLPSKVVAIPCTCGLSISKHPQLLMFIKVKPNHSIKIYWPPFNPVRNNPLTRVCVSVTHATHYKRIMNVLQHPTAGIPHTCAIRRAP